MFNPFGRVIHMISSNTFNLRSTLLHYSNCCHAFQLESWIWLGDFGLIRGPRRAINRINRDSHHLFFLSPLCYFSINGDCPCLSLRTMKLSKSTRQNRNRMNNSGQDYSSFTKMSPATSDSRATVVSSTFRTIEGLFCNNVILAPGRMPRELKRDSLVCASGVMNTI